MTWTWQFHPHPEVWPFPIVLEGAYLAALTALGRRYGPPGKRSATRRQVGVFTLGILSLWLASDWPLHDLAEGLYAAHMLQHLLLALAGPPLILLGTPAWLAALLLRPEAVRRVAWALTRPIPALVVFNTALGLIHWPPTVGLMSRSEGAGLALHATLVGAAFLLWMPVLSPAQEPPRLSPAGSLFYLLAQAALPMYLASFFSSSRYPLYLPYGSAPGFFGIPPVLDQRIAGAVMAAGGLVLGFTGIVIYVRGETPDPRRRQRIVSEPPADPGPRDLPVTAARSRGRPRPAPRRPWRWRFPGSRSA